VALQYVRAEAAAVRECDGPDTYEPSDELLDFPPVDEPTEPETGSEPSTPDSVAPDEAAPESDSVAYLDFDLSPEDIRKLMEHGVRPKDAIEAGIIHVTSSEAAFHLNRVDTGRFEGIMIPYGHLRGAG